MNLPPGIYNVDATWFAKKDRATNAPYTIDTGSQESTVRVNQRNPGYDWQRLGISQVTGGTLTVRLTDKANGYVIADAVRVTSVAPLAVNSDQVNSASLPSSITTAELQRALGAAFSQGSAADLAQEQVDIFADASVAVTDRPDSPSGLAFPGSVRIDQYAASNECANRDVNELALLAILNERTPKAKFVTRVGPRMGDGRFNDSNFLTLGEAAPDGVHSAVFGGLASDWFFDFSPPDEVRSKGPKDR